jgi:hypothetical protein
LKETIDYIRQRPHYDTLREQALLRIAAISRQSRDLKICAETNQSCSLRVISSRRITDSE